MQAGSQLQVSMGRPQTGGRVATTITTGSEVVMSLVRRTEKVASQLCSAHGNAPFMDLSPFPLWGPSGAEHGGTMQPKPCHAPINLLTSPGARRGEAGAEPAARPGRLDRQPSLACLCTPMGRRSQGEVRGTGIFFPGPTLALGGYVWVWCGILEIAVNICSYIISGLH